MIKYAVSPPAGVPWAYEARELFREELRERHSARLRAPGRSNRAELGRQLLGALEPPEVRRPGPVISYRLTAEEMVERGWVK